MEVDDIYSEEEHDEKIKAALPTYHYKEPQPDDGSHITEDDVNVIITRGSVFEGGKYRIYNHFQQKKTEKETVAFLKKSTASAVSLGRLLTVEVASSILTVRDSASFTISRMTCGMRKSLSGRMSAIGWNILSEWTAT